ncbi:MAG: pentapeptide repeat-containing protein [Pseudanabaenaceae cyanobacterium SKYGB_i_bin29]|nr:pentapeptide repeat-containing protein [Pseudanabaenaceae cyanobacterium SKYG29]MDW8421661.1 pentapeptide repeat-containing protein [Pseudanabaenaceae cyanobacterium SKYGB_i_bin29]
MVNLPHAEGFEEEGDLELPIIEDLPFATEVDIAKAEQEFVEQYGELLESIDVVDMGLITLIQGDNPPEPASSPIPATAAPGNTPDEQTIAYPPEFSPAVLTAISAPEDFEEQFPPENSDVNLEIANLPTAAEGQEVETLLQVAEDVATPAPIEELETLLQLDEEEAPAPLQADVATPATIEELETLLQLDEEETPILLQGEEANPLALSIAEVETRIQLDEELLTYPQGAEVIDAPETLLPGGDTGEPGTSQLEEELSLGHQAVVHELATETIEELETLLQTEEEEMPSVQSIEAQLSSEAPRGEPVQVAAEMIDELDNPLQEEEPEPHLVTTTTQVEEEQGFLPPEIVQFLDDTEAGLHALETNTIDELETLLQEEDTPAQAQEELETWLQEEQEDQMINYEEDEESAISEILTAFQTEDKSYPGAAEREYDDTDQEEEQEEYEPAEYDYSDYEVEEVEWEATNEDSNYNNSYEGYQTTEDDDYAEWQSGLSNNQFPEEEDEDSIIEEIITTFQLGNDKTSTRFVEDEEADAMVTRWQDDQEDYDMPAGELIDWEKAAAGKMSALDIPMPDFESFSVSNDPMETAIRAKQVLEQSKSSLRETLDFHKEEQDTSLPPLPPVRQSRTEVKPPPSISMPSFADEFYEEQYQPRSQPTKPAHKRKDGIVLDDDSDIPYRAQIKGRGQDPFANEDDWQELLDDVPPVSDEIFGVSEQTGARYQDTSLPPQFDTRSFAAGDTQPANLPVNNPHPPVSHTAPTFPEKPSPTVRIQQFWENNSATILEICKRVGIVLVPLGVLWMVFSHPRVNKTITVTTLRVGIWRNAQGKNLRSVVLKKANLENANLARADLSGSDLGEVNLRKANLQGAKLERTNLKAARLNLANFNGASLTAANLENAELSKTDFRGANLAKAKLGGRRWAEGNPPLSDSTTTCPNGRPGPCRF